MINDLSTCNFIKSKDDIIFIGASGTGKSHLSISLALKALLKGHSVYFTTTSDMLFMLHSSQADNSYHYKLQLLENYDLLIIDELGFKQLPKFSTDDFFNVISKRYEQRSTIITTNKEIPDSNDIFDEPVLTGAIVDRLLHHGVIFNIKGYS